MRPIVKVLAQVFAYFFKWSVKEKAVLFAALFGALVIDAIEAFTSGEPVEFALIAFLAYVFGELMDRQMDKLKVVEVSSGS